MDTLQAILSYCSQNKLQVALFLVSALSWAGIKLTNRYYDRKVRLMRQKIEDECRRKGVKPPPNIPMPPE